MSYGIAFFDLPVSPEDVYARAKTAEWLLRLMPRTRFLNEEFFACVQWIAGGLQRPVQEMEKKGAQIRRVPGIVLARKDLQMLLKSREERLPGGLETLFEEHPCLRKLLFEMVKHECLAVMGRSSGMGAYGTARTRLAQTFGLNTGSLALCEFLFINQNFSVAEAYFKDSVNIGSYENRQLFAEMLDMTPGDLRTCLEELFRCGLIENNYSILRLNESLLPFWDENCTNIEELFARPVNGEALPLEAFQIAREDVEHIRNLLEHEGREPVHILLYGPPGTGKTSFVHSLVRFCGIRAWAVRGRLEDDDKDRQLSLSACLHLASHHRGALVIVDEAEHLLDTGMYLGIRTSNKAGLNALLEEPSRRIVWIVNRVDGIDPAVRRRFSFSVHFNGLGAKELSGGRFWMRRTP